jgi:hypothetical protein
VHSTVIDSHPAAAADQAAPAIVAETPPDIPVVPVPPQGPPTPENPPLPPPAPTAPTAPTLGGSSCSSAGGTENGSGWHHLGVLGGERQAVLAVACARFTSTAAAAFDGAADERPARPD